MTTEFLTNTTRHMLLARIASLAGREGQDPAASSVHHGGKARPDAPVIAACVGFCDLEGRRLALIEGPDRIAGDEARERMLEPLSDQQQVYLDAVCGQRATTQAGHQARAICVALWDGGEIGYRARVGGFVDDRLVAALLRDLAGLPW